MAYAVGGAGVVAMIAASLVAPPQPEVWQGDGACEIAPCGTLEDPGRWRTAWWLWGAGIAALLTATAFTVPPSRPRPRWVAVLLVTSPLWLLGLAFTAYVASLLTSVQGSATVIACSLLAPVMGFLAGIGKTLRERTT